MFLESNPDRQLRLDSVDSTNSYLLQTDDPHPPGSVVFARAQTAGRGRQGRRWFASPDASLIFSGLLEFAPGFPLERLRLLPLLAGLALLRVCRADLNEHNPEDPRELSIKWPNDLYAFTPHPDGLPGPPQKLGGILIESVMRGSSCRAVIGLGLNFCGQSPEISDAKVPAGSLYPGASPENAAPIERLGAPLVAAINSLLPEIYGELPTRGPALLQEIRAANFLKDRTVRRGAQSYRVLDIAAGGELVLQDLTSGRQSMLDDTSEDLELLI